jgi:hypothetical protein
MVETGLPLLGVGSTGRWSPSVDRTGNLSGSETDLTSVVVDERLLSLAVAGTAPPWLVSVDSMELSVGESTRIWVLPEALVTAVRVTAGTPVVVGETEIVPVVGKELVLLVEKVPMGLLTVVEPVEKGPVSSVTVVELRLWLLLVVGVIIPSALVALEVRVATGMTVVIESGSWLSSVVTLLILSQHLEMPTVT